MTPSQPKKSKNYPAPAAKPVLAPSLLSADFGRLASEVQEVETAGAEWLHLDVMDGHFVPNLTFGPLVLQSIRAKSRLLMDCHLMVSRPEEWVVPFAQAGADLITVHAEATVHLDRLIHRIHELGCRAGVSINPGTSLAQIEEVIDLVDLVLVMSVNPGFGGQEFIPSALSKIERLAGIREDRKFLIQVDGGVSAETAGRIRRAGADVFVAGSALFGQKDRRKAIQSLRKSIGS